MKKVGSVILCAVMLLCMAAPISVFAEETKSAPIILVNDMKETPLYNKEGKIVYPLSYSREELKKRINDTMPAFYYGVANNDYRSWMRQFGDIIDELYAPIALDENGKSSNGTHSIFSYNANDVQKNGGSYYDYSFFYDWRFSPAETAKSLNDYINAIIKSTKCGKVSLVGNGYGSTVIIAYIDAYGSSKIDTAVFNSSVAKGTQAMDVLFTGKIKLNTGTLLNYFDDGNTAFGDRDLTEILVSLFSVINSASFLGKPSGSIEETLNACYSAVAPELLLKMIAGNVSYWSMISESCIETAKKFIFDGKETQYLGFIQEIDRYSKKIQPNIDNTIKMNVNLGMNYANITKYGYAPLPISNNSGITGDNTVEANKASFGATCSEYGKMLSNDYVKSIDGKYLSSDHMIDASTCLYPNNTWFVKMLEHSNNPLYLQEFIYRICTYEGQMSVFDNSSYPQFLIYSTNGGLVPVTDPPIAIGTVQDTLSSLTKFVQSIINIIKKIFTNLIKLIVPGQKQSVL